jgi:hypothetical protein
MVEELGLEKAKEQCKRFLYINYYSLQLDPTEANSHSFQYWGDVMDELNEMI